MQESLPITIIADQTFSNSLKPLLNKLEMWLNFQALKADWYGNENLTLSFNFTLVKTLDGKIHKKEAEDWVKGTGFAYHYQSFNLTTNALILVSDLVKNSTGVEQAIKNRLLNVTNAIVIKHGLRALT